MKGLCRWWRVIGRNRAGGVFELGSFLAASRKAALARAKRERRCLIHGLKLEAH